MSFAAFNDEDIDLLPTPRTPEEVTASEIIKALIENGIQVHPADKAETIIQMTLNRRKEQPWKL